MSESKAAKIVNDQNRNTIIYTLAKNDSAKAVMLQNLSNSELAELLNGLSQNVPLSAKNIPSGIPLFGIDFIPDDSCGLQVERSYEFLSHELKKPKNPMKPDGKIGPTEQGRIGDCWLLAQINAIAGTTWGRKAIKQAISVDQNGTCTVYLKGPGKTYTYTPEQIQKALDSGKYSTGDIDMLLIELAIEDYRIEMEDAELHKQYPELTRVKTPETAGNPLAGGYGFDDEGSVSNILFGKQGVESRNKETILKAKTSTLKISR